MKNRFIYTFVLICIMTVFPLCTSANTYSDLTDTSGVSDSAFFGVWKTIYGSYGYWSTKPQLDYDTHSGLSSVESAAKAGDYTLAKDELLNYYKNRTSVTYPSSPHTAANANTIFWAMNDSLAYKDKYITTVNVNSTTATEYTIKLGKNTYSGRFMLSSVEKSTDMIAISSREGTSPAKLVITKTDGSVITLNPIKDTYIRAGAYSANNYGSDSYLYVKDDYTLSGDTYLPYSDNTRRSYIFFDNDEIPSSGISSVELVINAHLVGEGGASVTDSSINMIVIDPHNTSWSETDDGSSISPMTWSNYVIDHFSWKGLPGGIVWEKPENSQSEFLNSNTRFTQISSLVSKSIATTDETQKKDYMYKAMELTLDFIGDTTDLISVGVPENRDIESANRCHEFTAIYKFFLDSEFMNADANTAMLKWLYKESLYLYGGAGVLYNGETSDIKSNNFAYTNRGAWHCAGFLASLSYFPEFAGSSDWETILNERLQKNVDYLIADDGCYLEATFGYSANVIKHYNAMMATWENTGKEPLANLDDKLHNLARYLMYVGYPDGEAPRWGDNAGSSRSMIKQIDTYADDPEVLYYASAGSEGTVPSANSIQLDSLKLVTSRTGWDADDSVLFINATNGGNHSHKDSLAFTLYHDGKEILEDTGLTSYDDTQSSFAWQRNTTHSHNTIEIDDTAQRGASSFTANGDSSITLNANNKADMISAWTDATEGFRHNRNLMWIKDLGVVIVNDMVVPSDTSSHKYTQNWHTYGKYASNPTIDANTFNGATNYASGTQLIIAQADKNNMTAELLSGYSSRSSNQTKYFSYEKNVSGNANFSTALVPVSEGSSASVSASTLSVTGTGDTQAMKTVLTKDGVVSNIMSFTSFNGDGTSHTFGEYTTDAANAYCVTDASGAITGAGMFDGTAIYQGDNIILSPAQPMNNVALSINDGIINIECPSDTGFIVAKQPGVYGATINGNKVDIATINNTFYINYGSNVIAEVGGAIGSSGFLWTYDSDTKALGIHGIGALDAYTSSDYTNRPWQSVAQEVEHIVFSKGITSVDAYSFSDMASLTDVWCSDSFFTVSGNSYTISNKFAGDVEYKCSSSTALCGESSFSWWYTPEFTANGTLGTLNISAIGSNAVLSEATSGSWKHLNYSSLNITGATTISADMSNSNLKSLYISGTTTIGDSAFDECYNLSKVQLTEGINYINSRAFALSTTGGVALNINLPMSLTEIATDAFEGRGAENLKLITYPNSVGESYATENNYASNNVTSGEEQGLYSWSYDQDKQYLYIDINGSIPSNFSSAYPNAVSTYEPYIASAKILHIGKNVTSVPSGVFNTGNITKVYCPYTMFDLTYTQQNTTDNDVIYTDSNGASQVYPAYITISGAKVPTHNAKIATSISSKFAGNITYKPSSGIFVSYSKTSSPYTIVPTSSFEWDYNVLTGEMIIDCLDGEVIGNTSIRDRSYYPWSDISEEVTAIKFKGSDIRTIGKYAFTNFKSLKTLEIPSSVKVISMRAFYNCLALEQVKLSEGLENLADYAFRNCTSLKSILVPESVTTIGTKVFYNTDALIICYAGSKAASTDLSLDASTLNTKRILSKLSYADGNISVLCGSDNAEKLVIAYYKYTQDNIPQLVGISGEDVNSVKDTTVTIKNNLSDYDCNYVEIMLVSSDGKLTPESKSVKITK